MTFTHPLALLVLIASHAAVAAPGDSLIERVQARYPNNTRTQIQTETYPEDNSVLLRTAHYFHHLYGNNLVLELGITSHAVQKEIYLHEVNGRGEITRTTAVPYIAVNQLDSASPPFAIYDQKIYVRSGADVDLVFIVTHSTLTYGSYRVEVKMNGRSYWSGVTTTGRKP